MESYANTVAHGTNSAEGETRSFGDGVSETSLAGGASGMSATEVMTPGAGLSVPVVVGMSESASSVAHSSLGKGSSRTEGRATTRATGNSSVFAQTTGRGRGEAQMRGHSAARTAGRSDTRGAAQTRGAQDAYKSVFEDLPSSFHSKGNVLYFAAQSLRSLTTGKAFINLVDGTGMKAGLLTVPPVRSRALHAAELEELRARILDASPSSLRMDAARAHATDRRRAVIEQADKLRSREPTSPTGYRIKKRRSPKKG